MIGLLGKLFQQEGKFRIDRITRRRLFPFRWPEHSVFIGLGGVDSSRKSAFNTTGFPKETGHFIKLALLPIVEGMVMALRALHANSQENLSRSSSQGHGIYVIVKNKTHGGRTVCPSISRDELAGQFIEGLVLIYRLVNIG